MIATGVTTQRPLARRVRRIFCILAVCVTSSFSGCASPPAEKPKPITEADVRARLNDAQTAATLTAMPDERIRALLERHFGTRAREAQRRNLRYVVEQALIGEDIGIGAGERLQRHFALAHEYDEHQIISYLEAIEIIGGRIQQTLRTAVGQSGKQLARLQYVDLDRAALRLYRHGPTDPPCCPSQVIDTLYAWRGLTLEALR